MTAETWAGGDKMKNATVDRTRKTTAKAPERRSCARDLKFGQEVDDGAHPPTVSM